MNLSLDITKTIHGARHVGRPRIVILGAGFGGLNAALALRKADADVTVIDQHNYHLFQPLLYQVATAGLSPNQIATPVRQILSNQRNATVLMEKVVDIDVEANEVVTPQCRVPFDWLIVATGAKHAYFGHPEWETYAPGLKKIDEATQIRRRLLSAFEQAEIVRDESARKRLLTFAVVGGGPTGVEMAGAVAELARQTINMDFRNFDPATSRIVIIEAGPRLLPSFPEELSASAVKQLEKLGVEIITGDPVVAVDREGLSLKSGKRIESATLVWGAGVMASGAAKWLKADADNVGRVLVTPFLKLPGHENIFVIGDTAAVTDGIGRKVPGVAPAAKQMGRYVAKAILEAVQGRSVEPFIYRDYGNLATIGRKSAVADFGKLRLKGFLAWIVWGLVHIGFLIGFRNRFTVMFDWTWSYVTYSRGARLITGSDGQP
jgi:NADH dehydrogenase